MAELHLVASGPGFVRTDLHTVTTYCDSESHSSIETSLVKRYLQSILFAPRARRYDYMNLLTANQCKRSSI